MISLTYYSLHVGIGITVCDPKRRVEFAELKIGSHTRGLHGGSVAGMTLGVTFDPVL
jgi:hypothetical protein